MIRIVQFKISPLLKYLAKTERVHKVIFNTVVKERVLQSAAVALELLLQTGCNSIPRDRHIFLFTKMSRVVLQLSQPLS
jgi:hypothetical protein